MHYLYILYSKSTDKFYVGETYNIQDRLEKHKSHYYSNSFTNIAEDWKLQLSFACKDETDAKFLENFIKKMKSKVFIRKIIDCPAILTDILAKK